MNAKDYPVTFGYGAIDGVYYGPNGSIGPYHRGDDRAMPYGTPVVVNGVQIGLSGNGNDRYAAHLHVGRFVGSKDTNPNGQGFSLDGAVVVAILPNFSDAVNGMYVKIRDSSGAVWVYLHMSEIYVTVGQSLEGEEMDAPTASQVKDYFTSYLPGSEPTEQQITYYTNNDKRVLYGDILVSTQPKAEEVTKAFLDKLGTKPSSEQLDYYTRRGRDFLYKDLADTLEKQEFVEIPGPVFKRK